MKLVSCALFCLSSLNVLAGGDFTERCEKLVADARIRVVFEDSPVTRDDSHNIAELTRLAGSGVNRFHNVLGTTRGEPIASMTLTTNHLSDGEGGTCAVPSFVLKLGFSRLEVDLARELTNPCRRQIVEEHEQEHVAIWRNHLRISARLLTTLLNNNFAQVDYFHSPEDAALILRERVDREIASQLKEIQSGINNAHQQIDSPGSYRNVENRMRACP